MPEHYDVLVYPVEWIMESIASDTQLRAESGVYYVRNWGRSKVICLHTLMYSDRVSEWFENDLAHGLRELNLSGSEYTSFASDGLTLLQQGALKDLDKDRNHSLANGYTACPLIPSSMEPPKVYELSLGLGQPAEQSIAEMKLLDPSKK